MSSVTEDAKLQGAMGIFWFPRNGTEKHLVDLVDLISVS